MLADDLETATVASGYRTLDERPVLFDGRVRRTQRHRTAQQPLGIGKIAESQPHDSQHVQRVVRERRFLEHCTVEAFGIAHPLFDLMLERELHHRAKPVARLG